ALFLADVMTRHGTGPGLFQQLQFVAHIGDFLRVAHALGLDAQDGDLVQQFAGGDGDEDVVHGVHVRVRGRLRFWRRTASSLAITSSGRMRSMTPGFSILVIQGSCSGRLRRYCCAASAYLFTQEERLKYG